MSLSRKKSNKLMNTTKQKSRQVKFHCKKNLIFGSSGILLLRQLYIENIHYKFIRLMLRKRKRGKKRRFRFGYQKYWVRCGKNIFFSKKSKNSRMGSGKGNFVRRATRVGVNKTLLEFRNRRHSSLYGFIKSLKRRLKISARVVFQKRTLSKIVGSGNDVEISSLDLRLVT